MAVFVALCSAIVNQYLSQFAILLVIGLCAAELLRSRGSKQAYRDPIPKSWLLAFVFITVAAIPMAISSNTGRPLDSPLRYTLLILPLLALSRYKLPERYLLRCFSAASIISSVLVLSFNLYPDTRFVFNGETRHDFGLGLLDSAFAAVFFLPFTAAQLYLDRRRPLCVVLGLAAICAGLVIMVMSGTRASWLALVVAPVLLAIILAPGSRKLVLTIMLLGATIIAGSYLYSSMVKERTDAGIMNLHQYFTAEEIGQRNSLGLRLDMWKSAIETFKRHPLVGPSYAQRSAVRQQLIDQGEVSKYIGTDGKGSSHNEILNALSQRGVLGFAALLLLYLAPAVTFLSQFRSQTDKVPKAIAAAALGGILTIVVCGLAEAPLMSARFATLYGFVLVLMLSMLRQWNGAAIETGK